MLVSHSKNFIYTKTIKTAGTSVEVYFEPYCLPPGSWQYSHSRPEHIGETGIVGYRGPDPARGKWYNHMPAKLVRQQLGAAIWSKYFKFCTIRNPFNKLVSAFHFLETLRENSSDRELREEQAKMETSEPTRERFRAWLTNEASLIAVDRDSYTIDGEICMDYFIKQEDLPGGIRHVCDTLGIPFESERILRLKAHDGPRLDLKEYYDAETIALVVKRYEFEFAHFDYPMIP